MTAPSSAPPPSSLGRHGLAKACLAAVSALAGCGGSSGAAPVAPASFTMPEGPVEYGFGDTADAGFAKVTIRTQPCGPGLVGVAVRVANTGTEPLLLYQVEATGLGRNGDVLVAKRLPYESPCREAPQGSKLAPGEAGTVWRAFDASVAIAKVEVEEPNGLARHVARFHLDEEHVESTARSRARPPPPAGALAVHETPYYRVAILDTKACRDGDEALVTYEIQAESFTNVPLDVHVREALDAKGLAHEPAFASMSRCHATLPKAGTLEELPPGGRVRAWVFPYAVPTTAAELALGLRIGGSGLGSDAATLRPGAPRAWTQAPEDPMVAVRRKMDALASPPPAGPPQFRELPPIPKDPIAYHDVKMKHLVRDNHLARGNHFLSAVPITPALYAAGMYRKWSEKRYDEQAMRKLVADFATGLQTELRVQLPIVYHGSLMGDGGEHSITLPDDLAEYVFLEVDGEKAIRAREAIIPLMGRVVGPFSPQTTVELAFDMPPGLTHRIMKGAGEMRLVVGGLGFEDKTLRYRLPLTNLSKDAPVEISRLAP